MKKYHKITYLLLFCGAIVFSSCSKWLDVRPQTSIKSDDLLTTEAGFKEALIGVYIALSEPAIYGKELSFGFLDVIAQQYEVPDGRYYSDSQKFNYKSVRTMPMKDKIWEKQYYVIVQINNILNNIDAKQSVISPIMYNIIKGELLGLRAFLHLDLMRMYGYGDLKHRPDQLNKMTIPYTTTYSKDYIPQKTYKETIALIEKDLTDALEYLKYDPYLDDKTRPDDYFDEVNLDGFLDYRKEHFNYWAAQATLTRLYYWIGNDTEALKHAKLIIEAERWYWISEYNISNSDLDRRDFTFSSEHLFSLRTAEKYADIVNGYFILNSDKNNTEEMLFKSVTKHQELYEIISGAGGSDYRFQYQYSTTNKVAYPIKLTQREAATEYFSKRIPLIKISEIFLIAIDLLTNGENPDLPKAVGLLNTYRATRGLRNAFDAGSDAAFISNEVTKEMRKDFVCEGQLFYYYKRNNFATIPATNIKMSDKNYVIPYPDDEITFGNRVQ